MDHPTTRVLAVLELLQTYRRLTGMEMAQKLEVDIRTLRRYITILQDLGIPIIAERGRYGAYELGVGRKLPPMVFTNHEALALALGLLSVEQLSLAEIAPAVQSARAKLARVLPLELSEQFQALAEAIALDRNRNPLASSSAIILTLSRAVRLRQRTHLVYQADTGQETERDFDPYGLAYHQGRWYAAGWCHLRQALRSFRLDRMVLVELSQAKFEPPDGFDALDYITQSIANVPRPYPFEVFLKADPASVEEEVRSIASRMEPLEGGVLLVGSTDNLDWLARQLARLPFDFRVRRPEGLRAALHRLAQRMSAL
jgi:predicted DNA-binding transcriptional regulator YafY